MNLFREDTILMVKQGDEIRLITEIGPDGFVEIRINNNSIFRAPIFRTRDDETE